MRRIDFCRTKKFYHFTGGLPDDGRSAARADNGETKVSPEKAVAHACIIRSEAESAEAGKEIFKESPSVGVLPRRRLSRSSRDLTFPGLPLK
jgi:hypothetical protein